MFGVVSLCCICSFLISYDKLMWMFFQIGLFTGVSLSVILGLSFGSLATLFTKDPEVLVIVRSGILVRIQIMFCDLLVWLYSNADVFNTDNDVV